MSRMTLDQAMQLALSHHHAGRLSEAETIYRQIVSAYPNHPDALHLLGIVAGQTGRFEIATDLIGKAIAISPANPAYNFNRGVFLEKSGDLSQAIGSYQNAIALNPAYLEAHIHLGNAWREQKQLDRALTCYQAAQRINPNLAEVQISLGNIRLDRGELDLAITHLQTALVINPDHPQAKTSLVTALIQQGTLQRERKEYVPAIESFRQAIWINPDDATSHFHLANVLNRNGQLDDAIESYQRAIECYQSLPEASRDIAATFCNLGNVFNDTGQTSKAIAAFRRALELDPVSTLASDCLLYTLPFDPASEPPGILRESLEWNARVVAPIPRVIPPHTHDKNPQRRLRIGYVSPDFNRHVASFFILPLLIAHDPGNVEIFCYANVETPDDMTTFMQGHAQHWRNIFGLSDQEAADLIRKDQIDILVDLTLHMAKNRLLVFAHKPAPVQVTWLGYPGTTGLAAMDYRLTDPYLDPPGENDKFYSEKSIRLPDTFWCIDPQDNITEVNPLPALTRGWVTFGCLNTIWKINDSVLDLWAQLLKKMEGSRLMLLAPPGKTRDRIQQHINPNQLQFVDRQPRVPYLRTYNQIDITLDTFPYNGHTTSLDSLWMGVPVITLAGKTIVGRAGVSQLNNLNLAELIAKSPEEYLNIAVQLANDLPGLSQLRASLRDKTRNSPLMDSPRFARHLESAYRTMWETYCRT